MQSTSSSTSNIQISPPSKALIGISFPKNESLLLVDSVASVIIQFFDEATFANLWATSRDAVYKGVDGRLWEKLCNVGNPSAHDPFYKMIQMTKTTLVKKQILMLRLLKQRVHCHESWMETTVPIHLETELKSSAAINGCNTITLPGNRIFSIKNRADHDFMKIKTGTRTVFKDQFHENIFGIAASADGKTLLVGTYYERKEDYLYYQPNIKVLLEKPIKLPSRPLEPLTQVQKWEPLPVQPRYRLGSQLRRVLVIYLVMISLTLSWSSR